ncbi:MAG: hypothetical protein KKD01_13920 [Proteobacteria bacterium]|nr:hypothetical protein [Pseudomonadota bacterium]MBU1418625.1 hypothetical protein [Pseudomonadota bacterium]MBU1455818.1 hypothetical protein [Pseudomonadota bacterium]
MYKGEKCNACGDVFSSKTCEGGDLHRCDNATGQTDDRCRNAAEIFPLAKSLLCLPSKTLTDQFSVQAATAPLGIILFRPAG